MLKNEGHCKHGITHIHILSHLYCLFCCILEREGRYDIVYYSLTFLSGECAQAAYALQHNE